MGTAATLQSEQAGRTQQVGHAKPEKRAQWSVTFQPHGPLDVAAAGRSLAGAWSSLTAPCSRHARPPSCVVQLQGGQRGGCTQPRLHQVALRTEHEAQRCRRGSRFLRGVPPLAAARVGAANVCDAGRWCRTPAWCHSSLQRGSRPSSDGCSGGGLPARDRRSHDPGTCAGRSAPAAQPGGVVSSPPACPGKSAAGPTAAAAGRGPTWAPSALTQPVDDVCGLRSAQTGRAWCTHRRCAPRWAGTWGAGAASGPPARTEPLS